MEYVDAGRVNQKRRTRDALIEAARALVSRGFAPTVEQAAAAAGVSRTTAYRYFASQHELLSAAHPETSATTMLPPDASDDPRERLASVVETFTGLIKDSEPHQRTMLRLSLEATPEERAALPLRQGRAIGWIDEALAPLRDQLPAATVRKLVLAVRACTGIESLVWLTDVAGLPREEAVNIMKWSASALLEQTLAEHAEDGPRKEPARRTKKQA